MKPRLAAGDVFTIPLGDGTMGVGQVARVYLNEAYLVAIFETVLSEDASVASLDAALDGPLPFLALTMDAKIHAGHWKVVSSRPVPDHIPVPAYKEALAEAGRFEIVDLLGSRRREATAEEAFSVAYRKVVAPIRLENALRASRGLEPWRDAFDDLRAERVASESELFG